METGNPVMCFSFLLKPVIIAFPCSSDAPAGHPSPHFLRDLYVI
jgi:hypothetical protein